MTDYVLKIATWLVPLTIAIVFHEVAHGYVAKVFGDRTASDQGRLSLNPLRHVDPVGTVILPLFMALANGPIFGWAKPVPVVPSRLRNPRWHMVAVAAAGPASNIIMACIACLVAAAILPSDAGQSDAVSSFIQRNLLNFALINVFLAVFNMLPIPPFDGSKVLAGILPPSLGDRLKAFDRYALLIMMGLFIFLPMVMGGRNPISQSLIYPVVYIFSAINAAFGSPFPIE